MYRFLLDAKSGTHLSLPKTTVTAKADHLLIAAATGPHQKKAPPQPVVLKKGCTELPEYGVSIIFDTVRNGKILLSEKTSINTGENAKNIYNSATQIYIRFDTAYPTPDDPDTTMTTRQIEQIAEQFDYSLRVENVDMDLAKERLKQFE